MYVLQEMTVKAVCFRKYQVFVGQFASAHGSTILKGSSINANSDKSALYLRCNGMFNSR